MQLRRCPAPADIAVEILDAGRLQIAPAILMHAAARDIDRDVAALLAVLKIAAERRERPAGKFEFAAVIGEAVLQLHVHRTAQRVEAEDRVRADEVHFADRHVRQQVEVHRVAKRLVEAHAIDVNRESLRRALQRRRLEPVIDQGRLIRVARRRIEVDAADLLVQRPNRIGRGGAAAREVVALQHVGLRRHRVAVDAGAKQRRGADHLDRRQFDDRWRRGLRRRLRRRAAAPAAIATAAAMLHRLARTPMPPGSFVEGSNSAVRA